MNAEDIFLLAGPGIMTANGMCCCGEDGRLYFDEAAVMLNSQAGEMLAKAAALEEQAAKLRGDAAHKEAVARELDECADAIAAFARRGLRARPSFSDAEMLHDAIDGEWIEVQMSMIQLKQAELLQVFLPYCWDGEATFYTRLQNSGFTPLLGNGGER